MVAMIGLCPQSARACSTCFGDPDSPMVAGAEAGVIVLAAIVYAVLFSMVGVFGYWGFRARKLSRSQEEPSDES